MDGGYVVAGKVTRVLSLLLIAGVLGLSSWDATAEPLAPVRVIVTFHQPPGASQQMLIRNLGGVVRHTYDLVPAVAAELPPGAVASLRAAPGVALVEEDQLVHLIDTELDSSWGVKHIGAGEVHPTNSGEGVKVAILDTGIDYTHPDLDDNYAGGYDFVNGDSDPLDDHSHGTAVAGVVAAEDNGSGVVGVAPRARLYALKVLDNRGTGRVSYIIAALEWAVGHDIDVVNMSLGSPDDSLILHTAIISAYEAGLVLVAAAGNSNPCPGSPAADNVLYPARFNEVIAVAATDQSNARVCYSSTGPAVELAAPGKSVWTTYPTTKPSDYAFFSGTSAASPHVAGAAALVLASGISNTNDGVRLWLQETADDLGAAGRDTWYGFGLVNVRSLANFSPDSDEDGFSNATEIYVGTDPLDSCPDDPDDDAWPPDINMDTVVDTSDALLFLDALPSSQGAPSYTPRLDLSPDGAIDVFDALTFLAHLPSACTNP
jgi:subtilisin family serine protease